MSLLAAFDEVVVRHGLCLEGTPVLSEALTCVARTETDDRVLVRVVEGESASAGVVEWLVPHAGLRIPRLLVAEPAGLRCVVELWEFVDGRTGDELEHRAIGPATAMFESCGLAILSSPSSPAPRLDSLFPDVPLGPAQRILGPARAAELVRIATAGWNAWLATPRPTGWTHRDLLCCNTALADDGIPIVWDLSMARFGPLGADVANIHTTARRAGVTSSDVAAALAGYVATGGLIDPDEALALEPAVAAASVIHDAALPAVAHPDAAPEEVDEIRRRARSVLDGSGERWRSVRTHIETTGSSQLPAA